VDNLSVYIDKNILDQLSKKDIEALSKDWDLSKKAINNADIIVIPETLAMSLDIFEVCSIKPIVIYQPRKSLPEFSLDQASLFQLQSVLEEAKEIARKVQQLSKEYPQKYMDIFYAGLAYAWSRNIKITPSLNPILEKGYGYPYFDTVLGLLNPKKNLAGKDIFNFLSESGFLVKEYYEIAQTCPRCESIILLFRDACINCDSPNVEEEPLIHHFSCGFQSAESHYLATNDNLLNEYFCPKCHKPLRHFGVDYDKPGVVYFCNHCNESNSDTKAVFKCLKCNHTGKGEDSPRVSILSYDLTNMGKKALLSHDATIFNAQSLLAEHLVVIPFDIFVVLVKKITAMRSAPHCSVISIKPKDGQGIQSFDQSRGIYEIAKALSSKLRKSDSVTYYMGTVFAFFTDIQGTPSNDVLYKKDDLRKLFEDNFLNGINFDVVDIEEFLRLYGGNA